jgi:hypothetical protein
MLQHRVWTVDRLLLRQWPNEYFCPFCLRNLETVTHLLMEFMFTFSVWLRISEWVSLSRLHSRNWNTNMMVASWFGDLSGALLQAKSKGVKSSYNPCVLDGLV